VLRPRAVESAIDRAEALRIFDLRAIEELLARSNGRRGAPILHAILRGYECAGTLNEFEKLFFELCDSAGLPRPVTGAPLGDIVPDFMWPARRVIVETDGWDTHGPRLARRRDLRRDRALAAEGWTVIRVTWADLKYDPAEVSSTLGAVLGAAVPT
jgi:very-short-patch-repair endonuclease